MRTAEALEVIREHLERSGASPGEETLWDYAELAADHLPDWDQSDLAQAVRALTE